ncbi:sugar phosphate isomerase/epimerase [Flaviaesturariibacter amylovorans]|uniref:Sugar phosphate isomerase/epimerase n=1 Tax=Flaviaesturariibacter amylovorans TaxID=1084520 RepID=A0ABP8GJR6_9BACT
MISRRSFLRTGSLLTLGAAASSYVDLPKRKPVGVQLYTVRDAMSRDVAGTLTRVAATGFSYVEGATYSGTQQFYGMTPKAFAAALAAAGLTMPSNHYRWGFDVPKGATDGGTVDSGTPVRGTIRNGWEKAVADAREVGVRYMVLAWLSETERSSLDNYRRLAADLNVAGKTCADAGIQLCYHNHDFEFAPIDGQVPYDLLLRDTDPALVKMELDLYWTTKAGQDPVALFGKHPGRFPLWHVKDMDATPQQHFTEVGNGVIDFRRIFRARETAGMQHFFVEQDSTPGDPFDSIRESYRYVRRKLV